MSEAKSPNRTMFLCLVGVVLPLTILGVTGGLLYYFLRDDTELQEDIQGILSNVSEKFPDLDLFKKEDPFVDLNGTFAWENDGNGLELTVVNALDPQWHDFFDVAIKQWDSGNPDSLSLTTEERDPDFECNPETGIMKVCDGNYGETSWKGINKVLLDDTGRIYASSARMNEYFLPTTASEADRQYTMCHEIGHGFGLPHTDENFYNLNQGNCMDYTTRPANNAQPDTRNFKVLAQLYGMTGVLNGTLSSTYGSDSESVSSKANTNGRNLIRYRTPSIVEWNANERRNDSISKHSTNISTFRSPIPDWIMKASKQVDDHFATKVSTAHKHQGWRLLDRNEQHESHEFDIGNGYKIHVHVLNGGQISV